MIPGLGSTPAAHGVNDECHSVLFVDRQAARQAMKRRHRAVGTVERALRAECSAATSMLNLIAVRHSGQTRAFLLLRCGFQDGSSSNWFAVHRIDVSAVAIAVQCYSREHALPAGAVRLVVVRSDADEQPAPPQRTVPSREANGGDVGSGNGGVDEIALHATLRATVGKGGAARLALAGVEACMYCLDELRDGDEVLAFPCPGAHLAHAACTTQWLAYAHTCPACRFDLPRDVSPRTLDALLQPARAKLSRLAVGIKLDEPRGGEEAAKDESAELDELRHMLASGAPSQRRPVLAPAFHDANEQDDLPLCNVRHCIQCLGR